MTKNWKCDICKSFTAKRYFAVTSLETTSLCNKCLGINNGD